MPPASHRKAVNHLRRVDPVMAGVIDEVGPCRFETAPHLTHFEAVARSIIFQQLSGKAAATIHGRFVALFGGETPRAAALHALSDESLRGAGVSRQKVSYLRDLAARVLSGEVPIDTLHEASDDAVIRHLTAIKGVGLWTAQMFLMFRLGRPDVLPDLDLGIRKGIQRAYGLRKLPDAKKVHTIGARWAPYRTVACWYLWRSIDGEGS
ncbi:MAG: DNA-3-methyladenine glycosylase 2 family protein [Gemmatimonadaceae bacterium]|nr:DNA-3-methyladenine glycosylase 2 family protein [Gemmatimonadaceae bacterium]